MKKVIYALVFLIVIGVANAGEPWLPMVNPTSRNFTIITGDGSLSASETSFVNWITNNELYNFSSNYKVVDDSDSAGTVDDDTTDLIIISDSISGSTLGNKVLNSEKAVVAMDNGAWVNNRMDICNSAGSSSRTTYDVVNNTHPVGNWTSTGTSITFAGSSITLWRCGSDSQEAPDMIGITETPTTSLENFFFVDIGKELRQSHIAENRRGALGFPTSTYANWNEHGQNMTMYGLVWTANVTSQAPEGGGEPEPDNTPPMFNTNSTNITVYRIGNVVGISQNATDDSNVSGVKFFHNKTGTLTNISTAMVNRIGLNYTVNMTVNLSRSNVIQYGFWANDTSGNTVITTATLSVANTIPTHEAPTLAATNNDNLSIRSLQGLNQTGVDADSDNIVFNYKWYKNGTLNATRWFNDTLILNMPFDDETVKDFAMSNNGDISANPPTYTTSGVVRGAYDFDGAGDRIVVADNANLDFTGTFSISLLINPDTKGNWERVISKGNSSDEYRILFDNSADQKIRFGIRQRDTNYEAISDSAVTIDSPTHVVGTYDGSTVRLYLNGTLQSTTSSFSDAIVNNENDFVIGAAESGGSAYDGIIDELLVYNRTLSESEVMMIFHGVRSGYAVLHSNSTMDNDNWTVEFTPFDEVEVGVPINSSSIRVSSPIIEEDEEEESSGGSGSSSSGGGGDVDLTAYRRELEERVSQECVIALEPAQLTLTNNDRYGLVRLHYPNTYPVSMSTRFEDVEGFPSAIDFLNRSFKKGVLGNYRNISVHLISGVEVDGRRQAYFVLDYDLCDDQKVLVKVQESSAPKRLLSLFTDYQIANKYSGRELAVAFRDWVDNLIDTLMGFFSGVVSSIGIGG